MRAEFDVALSFAHEDRPYVDQVFRELKRLGARVFYDADRGVDLWGKDLAIELDDVFQNRSRSVVVFVSSHYVRKDWTRHELRSALARAIRERGVYVLPARFDDSPLPGLPDTVRHVDCNETTPEELARMLRDKLGLRDAGPAQPPLPNQPPHSRRDTEARALVASLPTQDLPPRGPLPPSPRMPLAPNPLFVGRREELLRIAAAFESEHSTVALGQVVASTGLGGLGKTQLAVEFVHRYGRFFAGGVFWLSFASAEEIPLQIAACAGFGAVGLEADVSSRPLEEQVKLVIGAWQSAVPRLLVFDNCEEEGLLDDWRPTTGWCRVLVTSRRSDWSPTLGVTALPLDLLPRADSIELLRRYRPDLAPDDPGLDAIAEELGDLPLALHLAGSYLRAYRAEVSLDGYLVELRRSEVVQHASLLGAGLGDSPSPTHHLQSVAQTFALCLGRLDREREVDRVAIALLARMACMAPGEPAPRDLLARTLEDVLPLLRADGLRRLGAVGLVEEADSWLRLHRLVAHFVRQEGLDHHAGAAVKRALVEHGRAAAEGDLTGVALSVVIPHLVHVASATTDSVGTDEQTAEIATAAGQALERAGNLLGARSWYERAVTASEEVFGPDHPFTAVRLSSLAWLLRSQGEQAAARPLYERALAIQERVLGSDDPQTASTLNGLAWLLHSQGDLAAARPLYERALAVRERVLGPDHAHTAASVNNLALLLDSAGELAAARPLFERALAIRERVLGPNHPDTAQGLQNLAALLLSQGELAAAGPLYERALAIRERALGTNHPSTAQTLNHLAQLRFMHGEVTASRTLYERALVICERVLGPDHPDTAITINNLAAVTRSQGDLTAARNLYQRALAIKERRLQPDHPSITASLNGLASVLQAQGDHAAALPLYERALATRERVLGPNHPRTATSLHNLATLFRDQGDPAAGRPLFERALAIRERVLGPDHPDTVATRRALAELAAEGNGPAAGG